MRDLVYIGPTPPDEPCVGVKEERSLERSREECQRYIRTLRHVFGPEPEGAKLQVKSETHEFGQYLEVVCYFDDKFPASVDYAFKCEGDGPTKWLPEVS